MQLSAIAKHRKCMLTLSIIKVKMSHISIRDTSNNRSQRFSTLYCYFKMKRCIQGKRSQQTVRNCLASHTTFNQATLRWAAAKGLKDAIIYLLWSLRISVRYTEHLTGMSWKKWLLQESVRRSYSCSLIIVWCFWWMMYKRQACTLVHWSSMYRLVCFYAYMYRTGQIL